MCGRPSVDGMTHAKCLKPLGLDGLICVWEYKGIVKKALKTIKYKFATDIANDLIKKYTERISVEKMMLPKNAILIPIPIHKLKLKKRGFNQSEKIGELVAKSLGYNFSSNLLTRSKNTKTQTGLNKKNRATNVRGAFLLKTSSFSPTKNIAVILFDDIWTTGSTMREATKVLKKSGASNVWGMTVAR